MAKINHSARRNRLIKKVLTYTYMILLSIIILYPLAVTISSAFMSGNTTAFKLNLNANWTLDNFRGLFTETLYLTWYKNTLIVALMTMTIQVAIVTIAGYAYSRYRFIGRNQSLKFFLIIQMVPTMAALTAFFVLAFLLGAVNKYWYITAIYIGGGIPMNTYLMKGYFDTVPIDLDESAKIDGAGHIRRFFEIVLPLVRPMIAVQALWAFMGPFGDFMLARFLLRSQESYTVALGLQTFINDFTNMRVGFFAAGAVLIALPISILFFMLQKNFVAGLTSGGTKG